MGHNGIEFCFRVWVFPEDQEPPQLEVWFHGIEDGHVFASDWAQESFREEDFHSLFDLDKTKHWQVVGRAALQGGYDYEGNYDEDLHVLEFEKQEMPLEWFHNHLFEHPLPVVDVDLVDVFLSNRQWDSMAGPSLKGFAAQLLTEFCQWVNTAQGK